MWPSANFKLFGGVRLLIISTYLITYAEGQMPSVQQIHFVPKTYFLQQQASPSSSSSLTPSEPVASASSLLDQSSLVHTGDVSRSPRHLAPDRFFVGPSVDDDDDQSATATTSLRANTLDRAGNPIRFNNDLEQELKLDIVSNPNSNHYEAKILPNSHSQSSIPRKSSRGKNRRAKTRPPKNVIIYSLPEQSFYAPPSNSEETTYSEPDSREAPGLRSDLVEQETPEQQQQPQPAVADSKEFRATTSNLLSQKKALLGQCMAQCLDAIL